MIINNNDIELMAVIPENNKRFVIIIHIPIVV